MTTPNTKDIVPVAPVKKALAKKAPVKKASVKKAPVKKASVKKLTPMEQMCKEQNALMLPHLKSQNDFIKKRL